MTRTRGTRISAFLRLAFSVAIGETSNRPVESIDYVRRSGGAVRRKRGCEFYRESPHRATGLLVLQGFISRRAGAQQMRRATCCPDLRPRACAPQLGPAPFRDRRRRADTAPSA